MRIAARISRSVRWGWRWSGRPLVVLAATVLIVVQTAYLMRHDFEPGNSSGSRWMKFILEDAKFWGVRNEERFFIKEYPAMPLYQPIEWVPNEVYDFAWELDRKAYFAAPRDHLDERSARVGSVSVVHPKARVRTGVWAPTRLHCAMRYSLLYLNEFEIELAYELLSEAYREHGSEHPRAIGAAIRNQERLVTVTLYSGYVHNITAVLCLCVILRGVMNLLRWIRTRLRLSRCCCVACGYDLAGLGSAICPECGHQTATRQGRSAAIQINRERAAE